MRCVLFRSVLIALVACRREVPPSSPAPDPVRRRGELFEVPAGSPLRARLRVEAVSRVPVRCAFEAPAVVEADPARVARIAPPLPGRIAQVYVALGDRVAAGQALLALDAPELVSAQSEYLRAGSALAQAERTLARQRDLAAHGVGAVREVESAATDRDLARAEVERASLRLRTLGAEGASIGRPLTVRSPIAGRVAEFSVARGEFRNDPAATMLTVIDLSTVWVTADVHEKDLRRVATGDDATAAFAAWPDVTVRGTVRSVGDVLDPETRTVKVRVAVENGAGRLRPGMFATVNFRGRASPEVVVPTRALVLRGEVSCVFVEVAPWRFARRAVTVGPSVGDGVTAVLDGLRAGERVVTADAVLLP